MARMFHNVKPRWQLPNEQVLDQKFSRDNACGKNDAACSDYFFRSARS